VLLEIVKRLIINRYIRATDVCNWSVQRWASHTKFW